MLLCVQWCWLTPTGDHSLLWDGDADVTNSGTRASEGIVVARPSSLCTNSLSSRFLVSKKTDEQTVKSSFKPEIQAILDKAFATSISSEEEKRVVDAMKEIEEV